MTSETAWLDFVVAGHENVFIRYLEHLCATWRFNTILKLEVVGWTQLRARLRAAIALKSGGDVAEIGSTWLSGMVHQGALRPFDAAELERIGGEATFVPSGWYNPRQSASGAIYGIPWMSDARVIFYRADMLEQAGVQADEAFATPQRMESTLTALQSQGMATPWVMPTEPMADIVHNIASWVWASGGDFLDASGKVCLYSDTRVLESIQAHFRLHRFMPAPQPDFPLSADNITRLFEQGRCAAAMSGPYFGRTIRQNLPADVLARVRLALPPGPPFAGGSYLVVMKHIARRSESTAIDWIAYLTSPIVQKEIYRLTGLLPARLDALNSGFFQTGQYDRMYTEAILRGRHFPMVPAWDMIESSLVTVFASIWAKLQHQPGASVEDVVAAEMKETELRLNAILSSQFL